MLLDENISTNTNKVNLLYHKEIKNDITFIENNLNNTYIINNITSKYINLLDKNFIFNNNNTYYEINELSIENNFMKNDYVEVNSCILFDYKEYNHLGAISSIYIYFLILMILNFIEKSLNIVMHVIII